MPMSHRRRYDTISLDAGYTLLRPLREAPEIVRDHLRELGVEVQEIELMAAWRRAERFFLDDYFSPLSTTWASDRRIQSLYEQYYARLLADLGIVDTDHTHSIAIIQAYSMPQNWETYPGVPAVLDTMRERGYRLGIVSDWVSGLLGILRHLGLTRSFDWVLASGLIGASKPSPSLYRLAVQRAGTGAERMLHVGDSYYADILGARTVGVDAILIDWRRRRLPTLDVPVIHDLAELPPLLERRDLEAYA
jgi:putative hydrolase of the HAD superfamily